MNRFRFTLKLLVIATFVLAFTSIAQAQATRTWVSGVGDDVNPCSRTAPCKTWAGAISKTAAGGEIDALDPGGYGTLTITKSITVDGTTGAGWGSTLNSGGINGFVINDSLSATPNTAIVQLRNLSINGAGTSKGLNGIRFLAGKSLTVENVTIQNQTANGIDVSLTAVATGNQRLYVKNTFIRECAGAGIRASNTAGGGAVLVTLDDVTSHQNGTGMSASTSSKWMVRNSAFVSSVNHGVEGATGQLGIDLDSCMIYTNLNGLRIAAGTVRTSNGYITNNSVGVLFAGGTLVTYGDNRFLGNSTEASGGSIPAPVNKQ
jgi:hypothetical protein